MRAFAWCYGPRTPGRNGLGRAEVISVPWGSRYRVPMAGSALGAPPCDSSLRLGATLRYLRALVVFTAKLEPRTARPAETRLPSMRKLLRPCPYSCVFFGLSKNDPADRIRSQRPDGLRFHEGADRNARSALNSVHVLLQLAFRRRSARSLPPDANVDFSLAQSMSGIFKFLTALLVCIPIGAARAAHAEMRIALVIGNA